MTLLGAQQLRAPTASHFSHVLCLVELVDDLFARDLFEHVFESYDPDYSPVRVDDDEDVLPPLEKRPQQPVQLWGGLEGADLGEAVQRSGCPAFVAMMEPADFGPLDDLTHRWRLDVSMVGSVFVQGEVGS